MLSLLLLSPIPTFAKPFSVAFPEQFEQLDEEAQQLVIGMNLQTGVVPIGDIAQFDVPEAYYFLSPKDANIVLADIWGNPASENTLGLLMSRDLSPFDSGGWAMEVRFEDIGYVSDEDAETYDYDSMLKDMRQEQIETNKWRLENGFEPITLVGWAASPHYDKETRQLYWAKELKFGSSTTNTLNYNIRALGRKGVLVMNFIADMDAFQEIEVAVPEILQIVSFKEGSRYSDFVPGTDTVAAVGIGGLIAGKVAAKAGILVVLLAFLKKGFVLLLLPLFWLKNLIFKPKKPDGEA